MFFFNKTLHLFLARQRQTSEMLKALKLEIMQTGVQAAVFFPPRHIELFLEGNNIMDLTVALSANAI